MTSGREDLEFWDGELERLSATVTELLGEEAVIQALERTFLSLRRAGTSAISFAAFKDALKAELRRVVRPQ